MKNKFLGILLILVITACSSDNDFNNGKHQLEAMGYTNVSSTGHEMFCCGQDDNFSTGFTATAPDGSIVEGCFCSSIGKGLTIRFE